MDYMQFVDYHRTSGADITIGCIAYDESRASDFGLMKVRGCCVFVCLPGKLGLSWGSSRCSVCTCKASFLVL